MNDLNEIGNKNPFKMPEGYFDNLTEQIMAQLPEKAMQQTKPLSLWERVQPWVYMAAMFVGIWLMVNLFVDVRQKASANEIHFASVTDIDEFYQYYEDQMLANAYDDAFYETLE